MALTAKKALGAAKKYTDWAIEEAGPGNRDYEQLDNLPQIGGVELIGNKTASQLGLAPVDANGKVPAANLPSYVDDIIEGYLYEGHFYADAQHQTEITGESGKIYTDLSTNRTYRWSGSVFAEVSESLALGETSSTAFAGDRGKAIEDVIPSGATSSNKLATASDISGKADKVSGATNNGLASLTADGNLADSGVKATDVYARDIYVATPAETKYYRIAYIDQSIRESKSKAYFITSKNAQDSILLTVAGNGEGFMNLVTVASAFGVQGANKIIDTLYFDGDNGYLYVKTTRAGGFNIEQISGIKSTLEITEDYEVNATAKPVVTITPIPDISGKADLTDLAPAFSTSTAYTVGAYVTYNGDLYRCTTAHAAGAWNSSHFAQVSVGEELNGRVIAGDPITVDPGSDSAAGVTMSNDNSGNSTYYKLNGINAADTGFAINSAGNLALSASGTGSDISLTADDEISITGDTVDLSDGTGTVHMTSGDIEASVNTLYITENDNPNSGNLSVEGRADVSGDIYTNGKVVADGNITSPTISAITDNLGSKNLLKVTAETQTINGVTFTVNRNLQGECVSITTSGIAGNEKDIIALHISEGFNVVSGKNYVLSGITGGSDDPLTYWMNIHCGTYPNEQSINATNGEVEFTLNSENVNYIWLLVKKGTNMDGKTFYPMLRPAGTSDTFVPYAAPNRLLSPAVDAMLDNLGTKNLLKVTAETQTVNGVTFTVNRNAQGECTSITANGTATGGNALLDINADVCKLPITGKVLLGFKSNALSDTVYAQQSVRNSSNVYSYTINQQSSSPRSLQLNNEILGKCSIVIVMGTTVSNATFYPMIYFAGTPSNYVPYTHTNRLITAAMDIDASMNATFAANIIAEGTVTANGSDYAENFPALENCPVCRFVTLDGESVRLAGSGDYILGVTSEAPSVVGDKDVEGVPVGLLGKLWVEHDGSAKVNGFVVCGKDGVATALDPYGVIPFRGCYRVMAIDGGRCRILVK